MANKTKQRAEVLREYVPVDEHNIHGVTFDGKWVWFARDDELLAFDPKTEKVVQRHPVPAANAGTAFDGEHLYQLAHGEVLVLRPADGKVLRRFPGPCRGEETGMAWADGYLWIGQFRQQRVHKVDAKTGEVVKTLSSDRFVTGVTCVDGDVWHAVAEDGQAPEIRRLATDGSVQETLEVPVPSIHGMEAGPDGTFWCAGENGRLRLVRRK